MPTATINGKEVTVPRGTPIIRAAAQLGINIPHFCYHPALSAPANCRMCLVEVSTARKLEPACYLKVEDGMTVTTDSPKVTAARKAVLEFILINHPVDCPICDQAGECKLQDYYMAYDAAPSRLSTPKVGKVKAYPIGPEVIYDGERCILCTRCVRFCDQITGTSELTMIERGDRSEIRTFPGRELNNPYSMNVTDICPVGALTTRDFRFKCRVWLLSSSNSVCTGCAKGCNVHLEHHQGVTQRYRPRFNPEVNEYWMCDSGRLSYKRLHEDRLDTLRVGDDSGLSWPRALRQVAQRLSESDRARTVLAVSAQASTESLLAARLYNDEVLHAGDVFWSGFADGDADNFLVVADKNPNRAGITLAFGDDQLTRDADALLQRLEAGDVQTLVLMDGATPWGDDVNARFVAALQKVETVVYLSAHTRGLGDAAWATLPAATHAEQEGSFINESGLVQRFESAYPAANQALPAWEIFVRLARGASRELSSATLDALQARIELSAAAE